MTAYSLGPVKGHVKAAADEVGTMFRVKTIGGFGLRSYGSDHPLGLALDYMVYDNSAQGGQVAEFTKANASRLGVTYIIWEQKIWSVDRASEGWRSMSDRGSPTANHMDHVHVSFSASGAGSGPVVDTGLPNPLAGPVEGIASLIAAMQRVSEVALFFANPMNWIRATMFAAGLVLILIGLRSVNNAQKAAGMAISTVKKVAKVAA